MLVHCLQLAFLLDGPSADAQTCAQQHACCCFLARLTYDGYRCSNVCSGERAAAVSSRCSWRALQGWARPTTSCQVGNRPRAIAPMRLCCKPGLRVLQSQCPGFCSPSVQSSAMRLLAHHQFSGVAGTQGSTAVHVEDAARAYVLALEHGKAGNIYNITSNWDFTNKCAACPCAPALSCSTCHL